MKADIATVADIRLLVDTFYTQVLADDVIGHFFNDVVKLSWDTHMPIMYNFWATILLSSGDYSNNVITPHINMDKIAALQPEHFDRWLLLWTNTVNQLFAGNKADEAITRAQTMAFLINKKVTASRGDGFIH